LIMSRVTAAFVCALCDPDNPRPASIMCSNNCGRYVCAVHAVPRKGPGSAMVCQACAEALGLLEKPRPRPVPEVRPLIEIPSEPEPAPMPVETKFEQPVKTTVEAAAAATIVADTIREETPPVAPPVAEQVTIVTPPAAPTPAKESVIIDNAAPNEPRSTAPLTDTEPASAPKSAASETIVSQRGNTLQVPKVTPTLGKPPQPIAPKPRKAQRTNGGSVGSNVDWQMIAMVAGTVVLGIIGFVMILAALAG
jgi:hypothetical protein